MIARPNLARWRIGSALLAALMAFSQAAFGGLSGPTSAQAQACSPQIGIDAPSPGDTVSGTATFSGWAVDGPRCSICVNQRFLGRSIVTRLARHALRLTVPPRNRAHGQLTTANCADIGAPKWELSRRHIVLPGDGMRLIWTRLERPCHGISAQAYRSAPTEDAARSIT